MSEPQGTAPQPENAGEGRLVGDRYRLGPVIGRGGMATIHRATDTRLDREVALKLLKPEVASDPDLAQRFRREALAATVLRHPNIVACLDTGTDAEGPDGAQPYLVMEFVDGEDLAARLRRSGRLAPHQAARIGVDVARGLGVAHVRGIVHRDVKPGNILLAQDGRAMVTDFGIARLAMDAEAAMPGTTLGSVHYFSPEQARGVTTTPASDVYGLGLVLFEALTGQRPWSGDSTDAIALARVGHAAPRVIDLRPEVPLALSDIVARALSPEPGDRSPNGQSMAAVLESVANAIDPASPTAKLSIPTQATVAPAQPASAGPAAPAYAAATPASAQSIAPPLTPALAGGAVAAGWAVPTAPARRSIGARIPILGFTAGAILVGIVAVGTLLGAVGRMGDDPSASDGALVVIPTDEPDDTPEPTPEPTQEPTVRPSPEPTPTPEPTAAPTDVPAGQFADLCETFFDLPCSLGAGQYAPSRFTPAFDIELGDGWSVDVHGDHVVVLERDEGYLSFLGGELTIDPERGRPIGAGDKARGLIEQLITLEGIASTDARDVRIDGRRGLSIDVSPIAAERMALLANDGATYYLEPGRTTRIVAMDTAGGLVCIVIEPSDTADLRGVLDTADVAAGTIRWR